MKLAAYEASEKVRLGTVDTFQGEEAKIVIISLVRNSGSYESESTSIGFLRVHHIQYRLRFHKINSHFAS